MPPVRSPGPVPLALVLLTTLAVPGTGQTPAGSSAPPVVEALAADVGATADKVMALARAMPDSVWDWRPAPGVRSAAEVLRHLAYDHFYFPTAVGVAAPPATGISGDYATARAWGEVVRPRAETLQALEESVAHLRGAMLAGGDETLAEPVVVFERRMDRRGLWIMAVGHLHEHLGQLIAYARTRGVVPPWSRGG